VISPLLFLMLINPLLKQCPELFKITFADDGTLLFSINPDYVFRDMNKLNELLNTISNWFRTFRLLVNASKSQAVLFRTPQRKINESDFVVMFDGKQIPLKNTMICLGLVLHKNLRWNDHISSIIVKCNGATAALARLKVAGWPSLALIQIYKQLFLPYLNYMAPIWGGATNYNLDRLQVVQNNAIRAIMGLRSTDSVRQFYKQFKLMRVRGIADYAIAIYAYKNFNGIFEPESSFTYITPTTRARRVLMEVIMPIPDLATTSHSVYYRIGEIWQGLRSEIKDSSSLEIFKSRMRSNILIQQEQG
jgi:hypothetical protein